MLGLSYIFDLSLQHCLALSFCIFFAGVFLILSSFSFEKIKFGFLLSLQGLFLMSSAFLSFTSSHLFLIPIVVTSVFMLCSISFDTGDLTLEEKTLSAFQFDFLGVLMLVLFFLATELLF